MWIGFRNNQLVISAACRMLHADYSAPLGSIQCLNFHDSTTSFGHIALSSL